MVDVGRKYSEIEMENLPKFALLTHVEIIKNSKIRKAEFVAFKLERFLSA